MSFEETNVHQFTQDLAYFQRIQIVWLQARETKIAFRDFSFGLRQRERQIQNASNFMINVFVRVRKVFIKIVLRKFGILEATKKTDIKTASM